MITRRAFLGTAAGAAVSPAQSRTPNLLLIYADDLGWGDVGFNGRSTWNTPHLDRLASQGTVFTRWYSAAVVCAPSRAALLTGRYTIHCGVSRNSDDLPPTEITIAEAVRQRGYATALVGKWHRGSRKDWTHPLDQGFDETFGFLDARHAWEHFPKKLWRGRNEEDVSGYSADIFTNEGIKFIERNRARPWFLYLAYNEPHFHIEAPPEDVARYRGKFAEKDPASPLNAAYPAMIGRMDAGIGRVLAALDRMGLAENTLVVFSSDNGATFESGNKGTSNYHDSNHPFTGQKRTLNEGGTRMPGIVRWPGRVSARRKSDAVVHMIDVFPSFTAAAGGTPGPEVDGRNMLDTWSGRAPAPDRTLFWEWRSEGYNLLAAMRGNLKLLDVNGHRALYDVVRDPGERRNVFAEHPELFKQLQQELKDWLATERPRDQSSTRYPVSPDKSFG